MLQQYAPQILEAYLPNLSKEDQKLFLDSFKTMNEEDKETTLKSIASGMPQMQELMQQSEEGFNSQDMFANGGMFEEGGLYSDGSPADNEFVGPIEPEDPYGEAVPLQAVGYDPQQRAYVDANGQPVLGAIPQEVVQQARQQGNTNQELVNQPQTNADNSPELNLSSAQVQKQAQKQAKKITKSQGEVMKLQKYLKANGYYGKSNRNEADGIIGGRTKAAIAKYEADGSSKSRLYNDAGVSKSLISPILGKYETPTYGSVVEPNPYASEEYMRLTNPDLFNQPDPQGMPQSVIDPYGYYGRAESQQPQTNVPQQQVQSAAYSRNREGAAQLKANRARYDREYNEALSRRTANTTPTDAKQFLENGVMGTVMGKVGEGFNYIDDATGNVMGRTLNRARRAKADELYNTPEYKDANWATQLAQIIEKDPLLPATALAGAAGLGRGAYKALRPTTTFHPLTNNQRLGNVTPKPTPLDPNRTRALPPGQERKALPPSRQDAYDYIDASGKAQVRNAPALKKYGMTKQELRDGYLEAKRAGYGKSYEKYSKEVADAFSRKDDFGGAFEKGGSVKKTSNYYDFAKQMYNL